MNSLTALVANMKSRRVELTAQTLLRLTLLTSGIILILHLSSDAMLDSHRRNAVKLNTALEIEKNIASRCAPQCSKSSRVGCEELSYLTPGEPNCLLLEKPSLFVSAITEIVLGLPISGACDKSSPGGCSNTISFDADARNWGTDWPPTGYSMMGRVRLLNIRASIDDVNRRKIPGAIVELGVWRGGGMMLASAINIEQRAKGYIPV